MGVHIAKTVHGTSIPTGWAKATSPHLRTAPSVFVLLLLKQRTFPWLSGFPALKLLGVWTSCLAWPVVMLNTLPKLVPGLEEYLHTKSSLVLNRTLVPKIFIGLFLFSEGLDSAQATRFDLVQYIVSPFMMPLQERLYTTESQLSPRFAQQGTPQRGSSRLPCLFFPQGSVRRIGLV